MGGLDDLDRTAIRCRMGLASSRGHVGSLFHSEHAALDACLTRCSVRNYIHVMFQTEQARQAIAGEVRAELARQRKHAKDLAADIDMAAASLSRKLNGASGFTVDELLRVANALGVSPSHLLSPIEQQAAS